MEQYISEFGKISLETYIDNAVKKDLFVNDLNGNLKIHLLLKQPHIYQEALALPGGKSFVNWESDESIMLQEVLQKLEQNRNKETKISCCRFEKLSTRQYHQPSGNDKGN